MPATYRWPAVHVRVLLVEVLLELGELVHVPVFLTEPFSGVPELPPSSAASTATAVAAKARRSSATAIAVNENHTVRPGLDTRRLNRFKSRAAILLRHCDTV